MPPFNEPRVSSYWDRYPTPDDPQQAGFRVDSPLDNRAKPAFADELNLNYESQATPLRSRPHGPITPAADQPSQPHGKDEKQTPELRFIVVTNPEDLKDRTQMRLVRKHVMHNFLDGERQKPEGQRDVRVDGAGAAIKRKRSRIQLPNLPFMTGRSNVSSAAMNKKPDLPTPSESSQASDREERRSTGKRKVQKRTRSFNPTESQALQLVQGINRTWPNSRYVKTDWETIPFHASHAPAEPTTAIGGPLNPFNTWPAFSTTDIDINRLKWSCSQRFGSAGLSYYWVPSLLRARHAFLSTICISSAHDDIMGRASLPSSESNHPLLSCLGTREGVERIRVRTEVIGLVNEALDDPDLRLSDGTLISVLHLLNSEIMGCDDRVMKTHQDGLHRMVRQRGGLEGLSNDTQLPNILCITMYMIAALRECPPHGEFVSYANKHVRAPELAARSAARIPESPIYCPRSGYQTITMQNCLSRATWDLLSLLHELTHHFFLPHQGQRQPSRHGSDHPTAILALRDRIFALPAATDDGLDLPDLHARSIYEALRLTALLYAHALAARTPLSQASAIVSVHLTTTHQLPLQPLHVHLRTQLLQTDTSSLWGPLAGVLFFIVLVGGAGANPGSTLAQKERLGVEEDARKFLAAVAVRCSICLGFEYGGVVLETLRRLVEVESILSSGSSRLAGQDAGGMGASRPETQEVWTSKPGVGTFIDGIEAAGPEVPPLHDQQQMQMQVWTSMSDFAREFESAA